LLEVRDLVTSYTVRRGLLDRHPRDVQAVAGVSLSIGTAETLGLVGESGCGKSSLARTIVGLVRPRSGQVLLDGRDLLGLDGEARRQSRRDIQMVFQDPYSALNPHMTVRQLVTEGWEIHPDIVPRDRRQAELDKLLELVGLDPRLADRYPHEFSGGQRQRIAICRALAVRPRLLVCDEPVSALDVSIQAQVVNLLVDLRAELGLSLLFISHDLSIVRHVSDRVAVMYLGKVVEIGAVSSIYAAPTHPYTVALLSATLPRDPDAYRARTRIILEGDVPSPTDPPTGCRFHTRCWIAQEECTVMEPPLVDRNAFQASACHFPVGSGADEPASRSGQPT
jgi:oligopeptide/dipeptide ABC transporter ATP-binding protein